MGSLPQLSIVKGPQREFWTKSLHRLFEEQISVYGSNPALIFNENSSSCKKTSYNELNNISNRLARAILKSVNENGSKPNLDGDWIVCVCLEPTDKLLMSLLSIWKAGAAYLPLDPSFPENRIQHIITEARPILVICENDFNRKLFGDVPSISIDEYFNESLALSDLNILESERLCDDNNNCLGLVLYTSGSTGVPKGVRLPHSIVLNRLQWQWERFPYSSTESTAVFKTALTFVDSVTEIWGPLLNGLAVLIIPKEITKNPEQLVYNLEHWKIERLVLVPTLLRSLLMYLSLNRNRNMLQNLKLWVCSGEPLSASLVADFYEYFEEGVHFLCNFYGSTEVMGDVTYFVCENKKQISNLGKIPIGLPINNTVIYLLDADYRPVKIGEVGEIFVSGLNLASGYVNGRDVNRFIENPLAVDTKYSRIYRTGDYAVIQKNYIMYEGRMDSQVKVRGHRVDLSEIEKSILALNVADKAVVLCYHPGEVDQSLLAFVTLKHTLNYYTGLEIESNLSAKLPSYMIPQIKVLKSIPLLVNGKVDRQSLLKSYENTNNNDDKEIPLECDFTGVPENMKHIAKDLFEIIGNVIGKSTRATLTVSSNFYELGGNSLNSIFTVTQLRQKGYFISITEFITAKTLGEILQKISKKDSNEEIPSCAGAQWHSSPLALHHKQTTIDIITSSFYGKADLEHWLKPDISITDYGDILENIWEVLVEKDLSFVIKNKQDEIIAVALNFDARDEPEVPITSKLEIVFDFLEYLEGPIRDTYLPKGHNKILHSFMMGTREDLNAQENIAVMHFMENEVLKLAERKKFAGIFTTNTNPLTQQLGTDVYNYKTMLDYQVNQYIHKDHSRPFNAAPDSQRAIVHWKEIIYPK